MGDDTIDKSGYNEAAFKMARIDECQKKINLVNNNLVAWYSDFNAYGYIVKRTELENLMSEVFGKLDDVNKKKVKRLRQMMQDMFALFPVHIQKKVSEFEGNKKTSKISNENFLKVSNLLFHIHMYINELMEAAGYSTFTLEADNPNDPYN